MKKMTCYGKYLLGALVVWGSLGGSVSAEEWRNYAAPSELPRVTREMKAPGFWIARHPDPDGVVMGPAQIERLNASLLEDGVVCDLAKFPPVFDGLKLKDEIGGVIRGLKKRRLFDTSDREAGALFYQKMEQEMDISGIPEKIDPRFGFLIVNADERLLPTAESLYATAGDWDFDELQNSSLVIAEPVAVLHKSTSGRWLFVKDGIAGGWVEASQVAFATREEVSQYFSRGRLVVVTEPKTDIYRDSGMTRYAGTVKMGTRFVMKGLSGRAVEVVFPQRQSTGAVEFLSGFVDRADVSFGFLPFTPRVIFRQAFKVLNAPYGWGDMYGEQDCSRFIQMVFATVGLHLPRNSGEQGKVGVMIKGFAEDLSPDLKRTAIVEHALGAQTILRMKGHIALYLGEVDGKPYAIHATWAYREPTSTGDRVRLINRVTVSDLDLGAGSQKGSLLERIISARNLR